MSSDPVQRIYRDKVRAAARHLHCDPNEQAIISACKNLADHRCDMIDPAFTPAERLDALSDHASVHFEVVHTDQELDQVADRYAQAGELGFLTRRHRFDGDLLAAILRRQIPAEGERTFVALVDARGNRKAREFFSQAHEVAHPILEPQLAFDFREETDVRDAWEDLVDRVGAEMVFSGEPWRTAVGKAFAHSAGVTVGALSELRDIMADKASLTAIALAAANQANRAVLVVWAGHEGSRQNPTPILRVLQSTPSAVATGDAITHIHRKRRVPDSSPIAVSYRSRTDTFGFEDLADWRDSQGVSLPAHRVWTAARATREGVFAIIDFAPG